MRAAQFDVTCMRLDMACISSQNQCIVYIVLYRQPQIGTPVLESGLIHRHEHEIKEQGNSFLYRSVPCIVSEMLCQVGRPIMSARRALRRVDFVRSVSTKGPVEAKITSEHPTHKAEDEKVLAKAREVANDTHLQENTHREVVWSNSQQPRQRAWQGPRFEQTDFSLQPQPQPAIELIAKQPIRYETKRVISCNGGGGALGHPKVYINLDKAGEPNVCPYCRFHLHLEAR